MNNSPLEFLARIYDNVVLYDTNGNPSIFVRFPKMKSIELDASLPDHTHPAFITNGVEQPELLIGKYKACELAADGTLYSLPNMPPRVSLGADPFLTRLRAFGGGVSGKTVADSGFLLLLAAKNGWVPKGNNNFSYDYRDGTGWELNKALTVGTVRVFRGWTYECLIAHTTSAELMPTNAPAYWKKLAHVGGTPANPSQFSADSRWQGYNTLTGSGPLSWYLDGTPGSPADLNGNCAEQDYGYRIVNCEIQILPDNNAAHPTADLGAASAAWKAILPNIADDGYTLVAPGTAGTVKWTWQNSKLTLDTVPTAFDNSTPGTAFKDLAVNATNMPYVPHILKELGIFPLAGSTTQGTVYVQMTAEERFPRRGGHYAHTSSAGLGAEICSYTRAYPHTGYGARPRSLKTL